MVSWMPQPRVNNIIEIWPHISLPVQREANFLPHRILGGSRKAQVPTARLMVPATPKSFLCEEHGSTMDCHGLLCAPGAPGGEQQCLDVNGNVNISRSETLIRCVVWWLGIYVWCLKKNQDVDTPHCKNYIAEPVRQDLTQLKWPPGISQCWDLYGVVPVKNWGSSFMSCEVRKSAKQQSFVIKWLQD